VTAALQQCNALPLAVQLWRSADAQMQRSLMTAISAVASAGGAPGGFHSATPWREMQRCVPKIVIGAAAIALGLWGPVREPQGWAVAVVGLQALAQGLHTAWALASSPSTANSQGPH
jgi:hypothetical protein